jgi:hypothetical protein
MSTRKLKTLAKKSIQLIGSRKNKNHSIIGGIISPDTSLN